MPTTASAAVSSSAGAATSPEIVLSDREFGLFRTLIYEHTGIALSDVKRQLVKGRLQRRLRVLGLTSFGMYYEYVVSEGDGPERRALINAITTNKTDFFREPHHFDFVARQIVPERVRAAATGAAPRRLRVWHAGCSTGEEPYTLAITLAEALHQQSGWDVRQLASDIDTDVLAHAERAVYQAERVFPIPDALLRRYFLRGTGENSDKYKVKPVLRQFLTFRQINLLAETFPIRPNVRFDMIFCRNVVIYFDKPTQRTLFAKFARWLRPGGHLFIGHSESLHGVSDAFVPVGPTVYQLPGGDAAAGTGTL